jgi:hypothetical protein
MNIIKELICAKIMSGIFSTFGGHTDFEMKRQLMLIIKTKEACDFMFER